MPSPRPPAERVDIHRQHLLEPPGIRGHLLLPGQRSPRPHHRPPRRRWRSLAGQRIIHPAPLLPRLHQPRLVEHGKVFGHRGHRQPHQFGELAHAHLAPLERHHQPKPVLVRQRLRDIQEAFHLLSQFANKRNICEPPPGVKHPGRHEQSRDAVRGEPPLLRQRRGVIVSCG